MRRIQLHLEEELDEELCRRALEKGVPKAALIREALHRAFPSVRNSGNHRGTRLVGVYEGGEDESTTIDDVVYTR